MRFGDLGMRMAKCAHVLTVFVTENENLVRRITHFSRHMAYRIELNWWRRSKRSLRWVVFLETCSACALCTISFLFFLFFRAVRSVVVPSRWEKRVIARQQPMVKDVCAHFWRTGWTLSRLVEKHHIYLIDAGLVSGESIETRHLTGSSYVKNSRIASSFIYLYINTKSFQRRVQ